MLTSEELESRALDLEHSLGLDGHDGTDTVFSNRAQHQELAMIRRQLSSILDVQHELQSVLHQVGSNLARCLCLLSKHLPEGCPCMACMAEATSPSWSAHMLMVTVTMERRRPSGPKQASGMVRQ